MIVTGIMGIISSFNKCATYFVSTTGNRVTLHTKILSLNLATSFRGIMTPEKLMYSNCWKQWRDWNLLVATAACAVRSLYLNFMLSIKMMRLPWYRKNHKTDTAHFWNEIYLWISCWFYLTCGMKNYMQRRPLQLKTYLTAVTKRELEKIFGLVWDLNRLPSAILCWVRSSRTTQLLLFSRFCYCRRYGCIYKAPINS